MRERSVLRSIANKPFGFKLTGAGFNRLGENLAVFSRLIPGRTMKRLHGLGIIHADRERSRWRSAAGNQRD